MRVETMIEYLYQKDLSYGWKRGKQKNFNYTFFEKEITPLHFSVEIDHIIIFEISVLFTRTKSMVENVKKKHLTGSK